MVVIYPKTLEESQSSMNCAADGCKGTGSMLKCSSESCKNYFHVICAKFTSDAEATKAPHFFCSTKCKPKAVDLVVSSKESLTEPQSVEQLEKKIIAQKTAMNSLLKKCQTAQKESEQYQKEVQRQSERIKLLEEENKRIQQLESELAEIKNQSVIFMGGQRKMVDNLSAKKEEESGELDEFFQLEDDEEFKRRLTEVFQKKPADQNLLSQVLFSDPVNNTSKMDLSVMNETQKLAYYQRLHVQRLEAPKLMKYEGDPAQWLSFKANYDRMRDKGEYDNEAMVEKLRAALSGEAERFVRQRLNQPYAIADNIMEVLRRKFFQPKEAIAKSLAKLESWHQIPDKNRKELEAFLFELDNYIYLCENLEFKPELEVSINSRITSKLPYNVETRWCTHINGKKSKGTVRELSEFMWNFIQNLPARQSDFVKPDNNVRKIKSAVQVVQTGDSSRNFAARKFKKDKYPLCWYCGDDRRHYLGRCEDFKKLSLDEKAKFLSMNKICSRCLSSNQHANNDCPYAKAMKCTRQNCPDPQSHCTLMHPVNTERSNRAPPRSSDVGSSSVHCVQVADNQTMFKVVPIYVIDGFGRKVETTLLMDRAAGSSLVSRELFDQLNIPGEPIKLELTWLQPNATYNNPNALMHDMTIAPRHDPDRLIQLNGMFAINGLSLPEQGQEPRKIKKMHPFLKEADIPAFEKQRPQILLGLPHAKWMVSLETILDFSSESAPIAEKTPLGWTICGGSTPQKSIFHVCEASENECSHKYDQAEETESLEQLHELVKYFNSFEMLGLSDPNKHYFCKNDENAIKIRNETMKQVGKRYEIGLYWNNEECSLPNNHATALKRLKSTESRLRHLGMVEWANDHHNELLKCGFARRATEDDLNPAVPHKRINYVIGFVTFNLNKQPPKPRWVVDTASKHEGVSLNSVLLKGPDNLIPLTQALFHFRERKIAMVSDVTKMYHQIKIKAEDQQVQRYLWRNCNSKIEPDIFIFESMLFGPTCSPSQANAVKIEHAMKSAEKYPNASRVALNAMYMDDAFNSEDTIEEAVIVAKETIKMFDEISWEMVSFRSNSEVALKQLPVKNVDDKLLVDLNADEEVTSRKVLGLCWDVSKDVFLFQMTNNQELISLSLHDNYHPTKKEILSFVMKIFDCLGIISHFHIRGKMILQAIWRRGIGWNQHIPDDIHESWKRWLEKFGEIEKLEIPRHYGYDSRNASEISLHIFVDASTEAYAAVAYFRFVSKGVLHVAQVMSKCRVAPVKYSSVPRLELMAALIGARLMNTIKKQHKRLKITSTTFWTDSVTVLRWLYSHHIRLQQFVAPRISEIQETTNVNDWRYVPTDENVADDGTKWNDIDFSSPAQRWLKGPEFLRKSEDEWPAKFPLNVESPKESKILILAKKNDDKSFYYAGIFEEVSSKVRASWENYRVVIGWVVRFVTNLITKARGKKKQDIEKYLSDDELHKAEDVIFKQIQKAVFTEELSNLTRGRGVAQSSKLYSLNPFLDSDQIIRAKTRMYADDSIPYDMKCPPILPNKHETVHAFMVRLHIKNKHIGIETTIAEARSRAWIIHARSALKRVKHQCLFCIEIRARHQNPEMAPLPSYRLDPKSRPFEHCGADCCGPFTVYTGRSRHKREVYVVVFTCMITRAVYLRKLDHMSADEMMLAIQDVWTRRGPIRHMYSDNGRNFLGASNIIKDEHHKQLAAEKQMSWHFSPALTPHWGGVWERLIKDIKRAMKVEMSKRVLPEKVFECVLLQVEDIMNNRPLTHLPVSPDDKAPLTPNHLVKLHPGYPFVGGKTQPDDEESRYYTRRARIISDKLMTKWVKEYLPIITKQHKLKKPGIGLKISDFVIYTDPTVKPAEWQRGIVINVYTGRDGIARVADVKLTGGKILEKRSVTRLAKLEIDAESFGEKKTTPNSVTEYTEENCKQKHANFISPVNLINSSLKMEVINEKVKDELILALGDCQFLTRDQVIHDSSGYAEELREFLSTEQFEDPENQRTIKINRIPALYTIQELIVDLAKHNLWVKNIVVDSVTQRNGYFAYVTFDKESSVDEALHLDFLTVLNKKCQITKPYKAFPTLSQRQFEYGWICWKQNDDENHFIVLARKRDTESTRHAVSCIDDNLWPYYKRLKLAEKFLPDSSDTESDNDLRNFPTIRSVIVKVPPVNPGLSIQSFHSIVTVPTGSTVGNAFDSSSSSTDSDEAVKKVNKRRRVVFK